MKHVACVTIFVAAMASAFPAWGMPQGYQAENVVVHPAQAAGMSLAAAGVNVVYFPLRLGLTIITAGVGGLTGWFTGGNKPAASSVWDLTDGQAFVTPAMLEGQERWRFGSR
jgi:hypothetical protein